MKFPFEFFCFCNRIIFNLLSSILSHVKSIFCPLYTRYATKRWRVREIKKQRSVFVLSASRVLSLFTYIFHRFIDRPVLSREPLPTRTPRRTNLGQIVDNLLSNKMKNKATFERKYLLVKIFIWREVFLYPSSLGSCIWKLHKNQVRRIHTQHFSCMGHCPLKVHQPWQTIIPFCFPNWLMKQEIVVGQGNEIIANST